ncbi:AmiS/UreI family transporter [Falsibacillus pallidus]|uniref:AmiS/UreI family transporter n=1 Tax=Falsibacillus pallidus TaxID=493781 RepID=A0A370GG88_9BACI|nr:AmiS/UreI family transporter [Falsibacillus pallidus]RDI42330.1 AmiS/UreI family transporter [Falsibacillus pallidus]
MAIVGLLLSGAVLFLNSLLLLGKAEGKSVAVLNLIVGALQVASPFYLVITSDQSNWALYSNGAIFLFGLTYLYFGFTVYKNLNGTGLGWFSIWVSIVALVYAIVYFAHFHDAINTVTWFMWSYLWFLFFLLNTTDKKLDVYIGKVAFVQSWVTLTIPALLSLTGVAANPAVKAIWLWMCIASLLYFAFITAALVLSNKKERTKTNPIMD